MSLSDFKNKINFLQNAFKKYILQQIQVGGARQGNNQTGEGKRTDISAMRLESAALMEFWDTFAEILDDDQKALVRGLRNDFNILQQMAEDAVTPEKKEEYRNYTLNAIDASRGLRHGVFNYKSAWDHKRFLMENQEDLDIIEKRLLRATDPGVKASLRRRKKNLEDAIKENQEQIDNFDDIDDFLGNARVKRYGIRFKFDYPYDPDFQDEDDPDRFGEVSEDVVDYRSEMPKYLAIPSWPEIDADRAADIADEAFKSVPVDIGNRKSLKRYKESLDAKKKRKQLERNYKFDLKVDEINERHLLEGERRKLQAERRQEKRVEIFKEKVQKWRDLLSENNDDILTAKTKAQLIDLQNKHFVLGDNVTSAMVNLEKVAKRKNFKLNDLRRKVHNINDLYHLEKRKIPRKRKRSPSPEVRSGKTRARTKASARQTRTTTAKATEASKARRARGR